MKQEGDLPSENLIDVVDDLVVGRKQGYLYVRGPERRMLLGIEPDGIELVADSRTKWVIERILVDRGEINRQQLKQARGLAEEKKKDITNVLEAKGFAGKNQFENAVQAQARACLLDVFLLDEGTFEFRELDEPPSVEDRHQVPYKFRFDPEELLEEAKQRTTEFEQYKRVLPDPDQIFKIDEEQVPDKENESETEKIRQIVRAIKDVRPIKKILEDVNYSVYETYEVLSELHRAEALSAYSDKELLEHAREKLDQDEIELAIDLYERFLEEHPKNPPARAEYASALSKAGRNEEASELYYDVATECIQEDEKERAQSLLKRAYENNPDDQQIRETWFQTVLDLNDPQRIRETGGTLIHSYIEAGDYQRAEDVLERLLNRFPESVRLLMVGAELANSRGNTRKMRDYLERAYEALSEEVKNNRRKAINYLKKSVENPEELEQAIRSVVGGSVFQSLFSRAGIVSIVVILLLAAAGYFGVQYHYQTREQYNKVKSKAEAARVKGNKQQAIAYYREYIQDYPVSWFRLSARRRIESLQSNVSVRSGDTGSDGEKTSQSFAELRAEYMDPEKTKSYQSILEKLKALRESVSVRKRPKLINRIQRLIDEIRKKETKARNLLEQAQQALDEGNWKKARETYKQLRSSYPRTKAANHVRFPVKITSLPPGVTIRIDGKKIGTTPFVHAFSNNQPKQLVASRQFYETTKVVVHPADESTRTVYLSKSIDWELDLTQSIGTNPVYQNGTILVGLRNGSIWAGYPDHRERWGRSLENNPDLQHLVPGRNGTVYLVSRKGRVVAIHADNRGKKKWSLQLDVEEPLFTSPLLHSEQNLLFLPDQKGPMHVIDTARGKQISTITRDSPVTSPMFAHGKYLIAITKNGKLTKYDVSQLPVREESSFSFYQGDSVPVGQMIDSRGAVFVLLKNGTLLSVDPDREERNELLSTGKTVNKGLSRRGSLLSFVSKDGTVFLFDVEKQKLRWKKELPNAPAARPVMDRNMLYTIDQQSEIRAYHTPSSNVFWTVTLPNGPVVGPPERTEKFLLFATEPGYLYLLRK